MDIRSTLHAQRKFTAARPGWHSFRTGQTQTNSMISRSSWLTSCISSTCPASEVNGKPEHWTGPDTERTSKASKLCATPSTALQTRPACSSYWAYEQATGHIQTFRRPPTILSVQLLRFSGNNRGDVNKLEHIVPLPARLQAPCFAAEISLCLALSDLSRRLYAGLRTLQNDGSDGRDGRAERSFFPGTSNQALKGSRRSGPVCTG